MVNTYRRKRQYVELETGIGLKRICDYPTEQIWTPREPPRDDRVIRKLKEFDPKMGAKMSGYHRTSGSLEGMARELQMYNQKRHRESWMTEDVRQVWHLAIANTRRLFRLPYKVPLRKIHWYSPEDTNSGFPHHKRRTDIRDQIVDEAYNLFNHIASTPDKSFKSYNVPPVRPYLKPMVAPTDKIVSRATWCYPAVMSCIESVFGTNLYTELLKHRDIAGIPVCLGRGMFKKTGDFLRTADKRTGMFIGDYVKGDKQVPAYKLRIAFSILEDMLDFGTIGSENLSLDGQEAFKRNWAYVKWYFINTPFVFCDVLYRKDGGFPSGSLFTLLLWLVVNILDRAFIKLRTEGEELQKGQALAGGDDGVSKHAPYLDLETICSVAEEVGTKFHREPKSSFSIGDEVLKKPILSTWFTSPNVYARDEEDVFGRCCYPSRWVSSFEEAVGRVLSLSMSTANTMQHVVDFSEFLLKTPGLRWSKPIMMDRNIWKYHRYVTGFKFLHNKVTTLATLAKAWRGSFKWNAIFLRM